jgi:hypothetical protein
MEKIQRLLDAEFSGSFVSKNVVQCLVRRIRQEERGIVNTKNGALPGHYLAYKTGV